MDREGMKKLEKLATLIRYYILTMTTEAGSGHPTSSLSATELMVCPFSAEFSGLTQTTPSPPIMID
jgi:transketolase